MALGESSLQGSESTSELELDLVLFETSQRRLALLASVVQEVVRAVAVSPLPQAPDIIEGVINLRGTAVPVIDIRPRFQFPASLLTPEQHLIVARAGSRVVALRVDHVIGLVQVPAAAVQAPEQVVPGNRHIAGIARLADGVVVIQDLAQFLSLEEASTLDAALQVS